MSLRRPAIEDAAVEVATIVAKTLAAALLPGPAGTFVGESAGELITALARGDRADRRLLRDIEQTADNITTHSLPPHEFSGVPDEDMAGAITAVGLTLDAVPIDGQVIQASGFSAERLYGYWRAEDPGRTADLGAAAPAYEQMLRELSRQVTAVLRHSDAAQGVAIHALFEMLRQVTAEFDHPRRLATALAELDDREYRLVYRDQAGRRIGWVRFETPPVPTLPVSGRIRLPDAYIEPDARVGDVVLPLRQALAGHRRVLLTGPPGSGKSMALRQLLLDALPAAPVGAVPGWGSPVPLYLNLQAERAFPPFDSVPELLNPSMAASPRGWAGQLARSGQAVIMVDGLEPLLCHRLDAAEHLDALDDLINGVDPATLVILAAREGTLDAGWLAGHNFTTICLEPLREDQVLLLAARWYDAVGAEVPDADQRDFVLRRGAEFAAGLTDRLDLVNLLRTPLFAALACEEFLACGHDLETDLIPLVDGVLHRLASRDARSCPEPQPSVDEVRRTHREVAFWAFHNGDPFAREHLAVFFHDFSQDGGPTVDDLVNYYSILRPEGERLSFVAAPLRDQLAGAGLASKAYIGILLKEARSMEKAALVAAAVGRLQPDHLADEVVTALLQAADREPPRRKERKALIHAAMRGAFAARGLDPHVRAKAVRAAARYVRRRRVPRLPELGDGNMVSKGEEGRNHGGE